MCFIFFIFVILLWLGIFLLVVIVFNVVECFGFFVVGVVNENVVCECLIDDILVCLLILFFEIIVILYNVVGLRLEIVIWVVFRFLDKG